MSWTSYHRRGEVLRDVVAAADRRLDGRLPLDVPGVAEAFRGDELDLLGALQLRWHTRLSGRIERELVDQPLDLERAVVRAWHDTADQLPGIRAILDRHRAEPGDPATARAMARATAKEQTMLAVLAGLVSARDDAAVRVGARIEVEARATYRPRVAADAGAGAGAGGRGRLRDRLRAALAA